MRTSRVFRTTAAVAGCLIIPLWLASCTEIAERGPVGVSAGSDAGPVSAPEPQARPAPTPQARPSPTPLTESPAVTGADPARPPTPTSGPGGSASAEPTVRPPGGQAGGNTAQTTPVPSRAPARPSVPPAPIGTSTHPSVYYVALDDGGTGGVRFGCNDSLVAVPLTTPSAGEPLESSLHALLPGSPGGSAATPDGLYNALASSTLAFVSGYFDGATVVVNLSGTVRPGGACDIPRIEAQLTHTAVAAVGATRAEIYVNGRSLSEVLSLK